MQGNTILLKQDNGSYQLLRIAPAQQNSQGTPGLTQTGGNTIRLQTVPSVSRFPGPTLALRKTILTQQVKQNKQNVNFRFWHQAPLVAFAIAAARFRFILMSFSSVLSFVLAPKVLAAGVYQF